MASRTLVSGLPRSLPPLPPGPAPTCVPCVEGRQRAAPHSSTFPPTEALLQTLHMDVWGPARVRGQGHERYFLLVVDNYSRYTTVFPLRRKGEVTKVLIDWIRGARRQLSESFGSNLPVLHLHSDRGGEFSSDLLRAFYRAGGIRQTFTLPASPQQNGIAERRTGMVVDVARTSMIHAAAPHFLWPFAVQYVAHQINLQPRVSLPETTPTLSWTGKVGDVSAFRVWGCQGLVRDTSVDKLSSHAVLCDVMFDKSVSYYRLFPYRTASLPPPPLFLAPGTPPVDPLPPQGPAPSSVSQVDPAEPVEVAVDSGAARGAEPAGAGTGGAEPASAGTGGAEPGGAEPERVESGGGEPERVEPGGTEPGGTASWGAEPERVESGGSPGVPLRREPLSLQRLREWYALRCRCTTGAAGAEAASGAGGAGATGGAAGAGATGGATGVGAAGDSTAARGAAGGAAGAGAAGGAAGAGGHGGAAGGGAAGGAAGAGAAGGAAGAGAAGDAAGAGAVGAAGPGGARTGAGGTAGVVTRVPGGEGPGDVSASRPASPDSRFESPVRTVRPGHRVSRPRPPPVPGTHSMTLRPSTAPQRVPLPSPPASSLPDGLDPESDSLHDASPTVTRFLATVVTDPLFESIAASALVPELVDFAVACRLDFATSLVAESASASVCPLSVGGKCALGMDVLEDRQEEFECFAAAVPHLVSMMLAPEGDPDAPDIPTLRSYAEAIEGPYSSQWQAAMDAEMASWKSTGTYHDYELHSLDFSTAFLQGRLHEEIWLRRPPGFTGSFPIGTQWSLRRPVYGLHQAPREWHNTLRTTLAALGFAPSTTDPSLLLRTDTTLPPFYVLVYVDNLVFATADTKALAHVKSFSASASRTPRHCPLLSLPVTRSQLHLRTSPTSGMELVLGGQARVVLTGHADASWVDDLATQRSSQGYTFCLDSGSVSWWSTRSSSVLSSSCEAEIYAGAMAAQELRWLTYLLTDLGEAPRSPPVLYVDNKAMLALCKEHRLEH
ncbi:unnamed protein product [Closterium sp. NIES-53]